MAERARVVAWRGPRYHQASSGRLQCAVWRGPASAEARRHRHEAQRRAVQALRPGRDQASDYTTAVQIGRHQQQKLVPEAATNRGLFIFLSSSAGVEVVVSL